MIMPIWGLEILWKCKKQGKRFIKNSNLWKMLTFLRISEFTLPLSLDHYNLTCLTFSNSTNNIPNVSSSYKSKKHANSPKWTGHWSVKSTKHLSFWDVEGTAKSTKPIISHGSKSLPWNFAQWPKWPRSKMKSTWNICSENAKHTRSSVTRTS